jgi:hypothetical protein
MLLGESTPQPEVGDTDYQFYVMLKIRLATLCNVLSRLVSLLASGTSFERPRLRGEDNIKSDLLETRFKFHG